jgi:ferredoxin
MSDGIVIAGAGLASQRAAETLRRLGYGGPVRLVCADPHLQYDRPPLSKEVLSGEQTRDSVRFRPDSWYAEHDTDVLLGVSATRLNTAEQRVALSDGGTLRYEQLLIASGSRPRRLALLAGYDNVSELRTIDDALSLRSELTLGSRHPRWSPGRFAARGSDTIPARDAQTDHSRRPIMSYEVDIDEDGCSADGDCADLAPEVFEVDAVSRVVGTGPDELLLAAAGLCPTTAIRIVDRDTGEPVYP